MSGRASDHSDIVFVVFLFFALAFFLFKTGFKLVFSLYSALEDIKSQQSVNFLQEFFSFLVEFLIVTFAILDLVLLFLVDHHLYLVVGTDHSKAF